MALKIEQEFEIDASVDDVWAFLTDPERVASALPGAEITEAVDDRTYRGKITVRVGPVAPSFKGTIRFERLDDEQRVAEIVASGRGIGGVGNAEMRMTGRVVEGDKNKARVAMTSEASITGILAQFGRGMIQDISNRMFEQFANNMRESLEKS